MFALLPILAFLMAGAVLASNKGGQKVAPAPTPAPAAPYPSGAPYPSTPPAVPTGPTQAEMQYFDIRSDGVRVWKEAYKAQIMAMLASWGIATPFPNDPTVVQLVPRRSQSDATALQWAQMMAATRHILAVKYLLLPLPDTSPRFLRAVAPGEEVAVAGASPQAGYALFMQQASQPSIPVTPQPGPVVPNLPGTPQGPVADEFSVLGPELGDQVRALCRESNDPTKLILMADRLEGKDPKYGPAADKLRARARELQTAAEVRAIQQGRVYIVRAQDLQSELALWYTGNANRWKELQTTNPKLSLMTGDDGKGNKFQYLAPWNTGDNIILPTGWDVSRGLPPRKLRTEPKAA